MYISNLRVNRYKAMSIFILFGALCISFFMTILGISDLITEVMSIIWSILSFILVSMWINDHANDNTGRNYIFISFIVRFVFLIVDTFFTDLLGSLLNVRDNITFETIARSYYHGQFTTRSSNYPYVINALYHIFGENTYVVRLTNLLLSVWAIAIINSTLVKLRVSKRNRKVALFLIALTPYTVIYNILLLREAIYFWCITVSFCLFVDWMITDKDIYIYLAIMATLPALYLHIGYISVTLVLLICLIFDKRKKNRKEFWKLLWRVLLVFFLIIILSQFQSVYYIMRSGDSSLISAIQRTLRQHKNQGGGSQYLRWMSISNPLLIPIYTPIRVFFFISSPFILNWRGPFDIISFIFDGFIHLLIIISVIKYLIRSKKNAILSTEYKQLLIKISKSGALIVILTAVLFCWGVTTSGAAIRHRNCLFGVEVIILSLYYELKNQQYI